MNVQSWSENVVSWPDKYKPHCSKSVTFNRKNINDIKKWLDNFDNTNDVDKDFKNGLLITGSTGIGKTLSANIILKEYGYDIIELNSSSIRTSTELNERLIYVFKDKSIKTMFNKNSKTAIILDEIDSIDNKKEFSASDIINLLHYETDKFYEGKKISKKDKKYIINKNPIICTCNSIDKVIKGLLPELNIIKFSTPNDEAIYNLLKIVNDKENLNLSESLMRLIIPYCQYDFRQTLYITELLASYISDNNKSTNDILNYIKKLGMKDKDIDIYTGVHSVFNDYDESIDNLLNIYNVDVTFIPFLIHENFINYVDKNSNNSYTQKLDVCIEYYDNLINSLIIKNKSFANWDMLEYVGVLNTVYVNKLLKKSNIKNTLSYTNIDKSALLSKYNYRYYNIKFMNKLSKKLNIDIDNFKVLSLLIADSLFINESNLEYYINKFKNTNIDSKEFQKIIKLSYIYDKYGKLFTKKIQNNIDNKFNKD